MREAVTPNETAEARLKRIRMRAWRRGTREMDLVLGPYADARLAGLDDAALDGLDRLMGENDQDLYQWVSGQRPPPAQFVALIAEIGSFARARLAL